MTSASAFSFFSYYLYKFLLLFLNILLLIRSGYLRSIYLRCTCRDKCKYISFSLIFLILQSKRSFSWGVYTPQIFIHHNICCVHTPQQLWGVYTSHNIWGVYTLHNIWGVYTPHKIFNVYTLHNIWGVYTHHNISAVYTLHNIWGVYTQSERQGAA